MVQLLSDVMYAGVHGDARVSLQVQGSRERTFRFDPRLLQGRTKRCGDRAADRSHAAETELCHGLDNTLHQERRQPMGQDGRPKVSPALDDLLLEVRPYLPLEQTLDCLESIL